VPIYLGFDCSTQSLSAVAIDTDVRQVVYRESRAFETPFLLSKDPAIVHASPEVWVSALGAVLEAVARQMDVRRLAAISGSAQQHGSVYCADTPRVFTRETAPIWMDSSTGTECDEIEAALGGPAAVARLTGSRAFPRFTGPQIRKFAREQPSAYARTARIHLVSSYLASVLAGHHVSVDHADASGMNLMDIRTLDWSPAALAATAPDLRVRLPPLVSSGTTVGTLAESWQERTGLRAVRLIAWSGDNPCSLVGTGLIHEGQLAISLGTSDTTFGPMTEPRISSDGTGHVFASPLGSYMGITVFRNGSLARERIRSQFGLTWGGFSEALRSTPAGNDGAMMLPWFEPEITPAVPHKTVRMFELDQAPPARYVRAIVEAQAIALFRHAQWMGVTPRTIYATGGAAANRDILQVIADVFGAEVHRFESTDSAALGAAIRAYQGDTGVAWEDAIEGFVAPVVDSRVAPIPAHIEVYRRLRDVYAGREAQALANLA
jgi:xylulokinase